MDLRKQPKSTNVQQATQSVYPGKTNRLDRPQYLFQSPELRAALNDVSTQFRDKINQRVGKGDQQNDPNSPANKYVAENWLNRSKDKISTVKPKMKPRKP